MTTLRWDTVPKPRVERPPLLVPSSKSARRTHEPRNTKNRQEPDRGNASPKQRTVTVPTKEKDIEWAARQGMWDRKAGTECRKYKGFLRAYHLYRSPLTLRMWNAYLPSRQPKPASVVRVEGRRGPSIPPVPSQKPSNRKRESYWTRGLSSSDTTTPSRKTVRRYDHVKPRESELPPEIAAQLMKLNQQNTLVDAWR